MNDIDELLNRTFPTPENDPTERANLRQAERALQTAIAAESDRSPRQRQGMARRPAGWLKSGLALAPAGLAAAVAIVIAIGCVLLIHGPRPTPKTKTAQPLATVTTPVQGATGLRARLAVLRRAQTASERRFEQRVDDYELGIGRVVPGLTRQVATIGKATIYLIVLPPTGYPWPKRDGDLVALVEDAPNGITIDPDTMVPAIGLSDAGVFSIVGYNYVQTKGPAYPNYVAVIPDGVAKVTWTLKPKTGTKRTTELTVSNNIVSSPLSAGRPTKGSWYGANGQALPTGDLLAQATRAAAAAAHQHQIALARQSPPASQKLLSAFPLFAIRSTAGVKVAGGFTVSRPPLKEISTLVLNVMRQLKVDPNQARRIQTTQDTIYIVPGQSRLCVIQPQGLNGTLGPNITGRYGATDSCTPLIRALQNGVRGSYDERYVQSYYGLVPTSATTVTVQVDTNSYPGTKPHTIHPVNGLYLLVNHGETFH